MLEMKLAGLGSGTYMVDHSDINSDAFCNHWCWITDTLSQAFSGRALFEFAAIHILEEGSSLSAGLRVAL